MQQTTDKGELESAPNPLLHRPFGHKQFYTVEQLGDKQSMTPDGFLLCQDTPIARIGQQLYGEHELPGMRGKDGLITIQRDADQVFRPETIASFQGKPVTNDHPPEKVTPNNFRQYAVGVCLNPRRGDGVNFDHNFLYADLLITDPQAIADVRTGKREVSAGYDAEYEQTGDGLGRQYDIIGNHVALVNRGRCGPLCSIGDEEMATRVRVNDSRRRSIRDGLLAAFRSKDESGFMDQLEELQKVPELLGEQVSGESSGGEGHTGDTHVSINLGGGGSSPSISSGGGGMDDDPSAGMDPAPDPAAGGGNVAQMMQQMMQRMDRIEQAIVALAQGDDGDPGMDDPNAGDDPDQDRMYGDRRRGMRDRLTRTRDEPPTAPPTDEPDIDPSQNLPYGAGAQEKEFESPQLGTEDRRRTGDRRRTADQQGGRQTFIGDSSSLRGEFQDVLSRAELLSPGIQVPTFDAKITAGVTQDTMCMLKRQALANAWRDSTKHSFIAPLLNGKTPDFGRMTCDQIAPVFTGASELVRFQNNNQYLHVRPNNQGVRGAGGAPAPRDINTRNKEFWANR